MLDTVTWGDLHQQGVTCINKKIDFPLHDSYF